MFEKELRTALSLVDEASRIALAVYETDFDVHEKGPRDLVTEADRRVNRFLCDAIREAFPDDLVVGEESGFGGSVDAPRAWFIDPVDGTADFVQKNGEWSIMIGLAVDARARLGVVAQPATGDVYYAAHGDGAHHRVGTGRRKLRVSDFDETAEMTAVLSRNHPDPQTVALLARLGIHRSYPHGSIGCKLAQIADQRADLYANFSGKCHMWDLCGPEAILREAGGAVVHPDGSPIVYRGATTRVERAFVATTSRLLPSVLEAALAVEEEAR